MAAEETDQNDKEEVKEPVAKPDELPSVEDRSLFLGASQDIS